jgi:type IV pilus assembly protein PilB
LQFACTSADNIQKTLAETMESRIPQLLLNAKIISDDQYKALLAQQKHSGNTIISDLAKMGLVSEMQAAKFLAGYYNLKLVSLDNAEIPEDILKILSTEFVQKYSVIPLKRSGRNLTVAMVDPSIDFIIEDIKFISGYEVDPVIVTENVFLRTIERCYKLAGTLDKILQDMDDSSVEIVQENEDDSDLTKLRDAIEDAPIVKLIDGLIADAVKQNASDIHIEPYETMLRIRIRIDGVLQEVMSPPHHLKGAIISRIKIMANLDIAEKRVPQDGHIKMKFGEKTVDLRVSTLPTVFGEKVVLRILDKTNLTLDLSKFGFEEKALKDFQKAIAMPYGMVLVTGPTGSGKTTTLYSALSLVNTGTVNTMTAEDPVEYHFEGMNQVPVREDIGLGFATALRAFLRQDPDIIMIGEVRDLETGSIAIRAALTGHLVLSTLHTNSAAATISRLIDMGIEPFLVSSSVNLIMAQRLMRKICSNCKTKVEVHPEMLREAGIDPTEGAKFTYYKGKGCAECNETGYRGRTGIYEVMPISPIMRRMVLEGASTADMEAQAVKEGMLTLHDAAITKCQTGITTLEEVFRVTGEG